MKPPVPGEEFARLAALHRYLLDEPRPEPAFDWLTRMAARLLRVPIALVTAVDQSHQWCCKSAYGVSDRDMACGVTFCGHAILRDEPTLVPDAARDERFADDAWVRGTPHIRAYAGVPVRAPDGSRLGMFCVMDRVPREFSPEEQQILRDFAHVVQDRLEQQLAVRERMQQAAAVANLQSGVLLTDPSLPDNPIIFVNPGFCALTGYRAEEIVGRNCRFLQGPSSDPATVRAIHEAIAQRRCFQGVLLNYKKDGTPFWNELRISPVFDEAGCLQNFVGLQTDVTERKRSTDELQKSHDQLKEMEQQRDNLTNMIVHDMRSPLTTMIASLEMLEAPAGARLTQEERSHLERAQRSASSLQQMITSLLDVKRLESREMPLRIQPHDLCALVTSAIDALAPLLGRRTLRRFFPKTPVNVECDAALIRRVVENVVGNAIKFTPHDGEIDVRIEPEDQRATVSVRDTGPGVPPEFHGRIFQKFAQVDAFRYRHSSGLGLAFCKLAVEAHGGRIGMRNAADRGSVFWFELRRSC